MCLLSRSCVDLILCFQPRAFEELGQRTEIVGDRIASDRLDALDIRLKGAEWEVRDGRHDQTQQRDTSSD